MSEVVDFPRPNARDARARDAAQLLHILPAHHPDFAKAVSCFATLAHAASWSLEAVNEKLEPYGYRCEVGGASQPPA
jgi:hypothetical protein